MKGEDSLTLNRKNILILQLLASRRIGRSRPLKATHLPLLFRATCCHGDEDRLPLRLRQWSQQAGEAEDRAGYADHQPIPVQGPRAVLLRTQTPSPLRRGGERDVAAHLAVWGVGACGVPPEGSQEHSRRVCGTEKGVAVGPAGNVLTVHRPEGTN